MNPLFNAGGMDFTQLLTAFNQFKANFQGDPEQEVRRLLASGRMNQVQLDQLQQMAQTLQALLK